MTEQTQRVRQLAAECGFARVGIAAAGPLARSAYLEQWLDRGWAGEMEYLSRHRAIRADARRLLPGARSILVVADMYHAPDGRNAASEVASPRTPSTAGPTGRIARYAWGRDYHRVLKKKLHRLADRMRAELPGSPEMRVCVDTAPLVEREWAAAAGVGWIGKNTMVLHEAIGSFFFLGEILTTLELAPEPAAVDHCGTCTRCLDACPTHALVAPYQMDARRCISYLTIEHRGPIADDLRSHMGDWLYGCDICQEVCPHNREREGGGHRRSDAPIDPAYALSERNPLPPSAWLPLLQQWTEAEYADHLAGSAMKRATLSMLQRNAAIAACNQAADS